MASSPRRGTRTLVLVVGMHRSGTSAVAGELAGRGVDFGGRLLDANEFNPKGYFEDREAVACNEDLFAATYGHWSAPLRTDAVRLAAAGQAHGAGLADCLERLTVGGLGGLKDPRICRLAPLWDDAAQRLGLTVLPLVVLRDPADVAASLQRRDCMAPAWSAALWLLYLRDTLAWVAEGGRPFGLVAYDDCLERPDLLGEWLARHVPQHAAPASGASFLEPRLRHAPPPGHLVDAGVAAARGVFAALKALTGGGAADVEPAAARGLLPAVDAALDAVLPLVGPETLWRVSSPELSACWVARRARQRADTAGMWERVTGAEAALDALHAESQELWERVHGVEAHRDALHAENQELWKRVNGVEGHRDALHAENQELWKRVHGVEGHRDALHAENQDLWKRVHDAEDRLVRSEERLAESEKRFLTLRHTRVVRVAKALRLISEKTDA